MLTDTLVKENEKNRMVQEDYTISPRVNILEGDMDFTLEIEMPNLNKDLIEIELAGKELKIVGKKQSFNDLQKYKPILVERTPFSYKRVFIVDAEIKRDKIQANYENGLLVLKLPKPAKSLPKKIQIN